MHVPSYGRAWSTTMRRPARPLLRSIRMTLGGSIFCYPPAHGQLTADRAGAGSRCIGAAAPERRVLGPLARPIPRLEPTVPSASELASGPAAQPPPR